MHQKARKKEAEAGKVEWLKMKLKKEIKGVLVLTKPKDK